MYHFGTIHLGLHYFLKYRLRGFQYNKGVTGQKSKRHVMVYCTSQLWKLSHHDVEISEKLRIHNIVYMYNWFIYLDIETIKSMISTINEVYKVHNSTNRCTRK